MVTHRGVDGGDRLIHVVADGHALPGGQPVRLHDDPMPHVAHVGGGAIDPAAVAGIVCRVHPHRAAYLDRPVARDAPEAKFSIQYCAAVALTLGK